MPEGLGRFAARAVELRSGLIGRSPRELRASPTAGEPIRGGWCFAMTVSVMPAVGGLR